MVIAGIRKSNTQGANAKNLSMLRKPKSNKLVAGSIHINSPQINSSTITTTYPTKLLKYPFISFRKILYISILPSFARKYTIGKGKIGQIAFFYTNIIIGGVGCGMERGWGGWGGVVTNRKTIQ
jgi:hypothetical protein